MRADAKEAERCRPLSTRWRVTSARYILTLMSSYSWDPAQYERFADQRGRPFFDLVGRVRATGPGYVVDLGCGPGTLTATLIERWPEALVEGVDSSADMLRAAAARAVPGRLDFRLGDLREWEPQRPVSVVVSNATLQWVPDHADLLSRLVGHVEDCGWLAFQVPGNTDAPAHTAMDELSASPTWRTRLAGIGRDPAWVLSPAGYLALLMDLGCAVDAWETTYLHVLNGPDAVLEWMKGTALRPVLEALAVDERAAFMAEYARRVRDAYPPRPGGQVILPFRRIFVVAQKGATA